MRRCTRFCEPIGGRMIPMGVDVRRAVLAHLGSGADSRFGRWTSRRHRATAGRSAPTPTSGKRCRALVGDGLVYLETAGQGSGTDNWRWRLSVEGQRVAKGGAWEPRDPDGYLDRIRREIPDLDDLVELYLTEALQSFSLLIRDIEGQAAACGDGVDQGLQLWWRGRLGPCRPPALQCDPGGKPGAYRAQRPRPGRCRR